MVTNFPSKIYILQVSTGSTEKAIKNHQKNHSIGRNYQFFIHGKVSGEKLGRFKSDFRGHAVHTSEILPPFTDLFCFSVIIQCKLINENCFLHCKTSFHQSTYTESLLRNVKILREWREYITQNGQSVQVF